MRNVSLPKLGKFAVAFFVIVPLNLHAKEGAAPVSSHIIKSDKFVDARELVVGETQDTLIVFDIDDTLLTSETFFGSDHWYEWQRGLKKGDVGYVPCKFDVIALNYEMGTQRVVEPEAVDIVK